VRAALAQDPERNALPGGQDLIVAQEAEIMNPAPFMRALGSRDFGSGNVYEMRTYTYAAGDIPKVLEAWAKVIESRERLSPLAGRLSSAPPGLGLGPGLFQIRHVAGRGGVAEARAARHRQRGDRGLVLHDLRHDRLLGAVEDAALGGDEAL